MIKACLARLKRLRQHGYEPASSSRRHLALGGLLVVVGGGVTGLGTMAGGRNASKAHQGAGATFIVDSRKEAAAMSLPPTGLLLRTMGHARLNDGGTALWHRVAAAPAHAGKFRSADGAWWELATDDAVVDVRQFGAGTGIATAPIQNALDYAGTHAPCRVIANDRQYVTDEVTVRSGVRFECDLRINDPARPGVEKTVVRVERSCEVVGRIEGSHTSHVEVVERGIYPAYIGCHDVSLDVEITGVTVGISALYGVAGTDEPPRRWQGKITCRDIAGFVPAPQGNGYGLNGTLCDSRLEVVTINVPRHGVYLVAGASNNEIVQRDEGCRFAPFAIAANSGQPACVGNRATVYVRQHRGDYPNVPCSGGIVAGNCVQNEITIMVSDSAPLQSGFRWQANSPDAFPQRNSIKVAFEGVISGIAVVDGNSGSGNRVWVTGRGSCVSTPSCVVYVGQNDNITPDRRSGLAAVIEQIDFDALSSIEHAVIVAQGYADVDLGQRVIHVRHLKSRALNFYGFGDRVIGQL